MIVIDGKGLNGEKADAIECIPAQQETAEKVQIGVCH